MRALYDFAGEPGTAELSIVAGEVLTVMRDNVGDGWCEGYNQNGQSGLFPAAYVQAVEAGAPSGIARILFHLDFNFFLIYDQDILRLKMILGLFFGCRDYGACNLIFVVSLIYFELLEDKRFYLCLLAELTEFSHSLK